MRNFLCNKKRAIFRLLFRFLFWLLFSHYRIVATIAKASMAIKTTTPPATIANVSFFIFFSFFRFYISYKRFQEKATKRSQVDSRLQVLAACQLTSTTIAPLFS